MDWRAKVELYEQIRREYEFGVGSVIGVARKLGVHRRMVREAVRNAVPAQRKKTERPSVKMAPAMSLIDAILESDRKAPRKQRHTARRIKTLEEFDFAQSPHIPAARIRALAEGGYLERAEPVLLLGDPGTGKSHLAIAACRQRRRVRFTTAAALVNQLVEAQREHSLSRMLARWSRVELIVIDELGYVPLAEVAAELLFQVVAERAEKAAVIVTTNLPFSEWPHVFTNARLCKAMLDRLTDQAHIIETGAESYRFLRTLRKKKE